MKPKEFLELAYPCVIQGKDGFELQVEQQDPYTFAKVTYEYDPMSPVAFFLPKVIHGVGFAKCNPREDVWSADLGKEIATRRAIKDMYECRQEGMTFVENIIGKLKLAVEGNDLQVQQVYPHGSYFCKAYDYDTEVFYPDNPLPCFCGNAPVYETVMIPSPEYRIYCSVCCNTTNKHPSKALALRQWREINTH